MILDCAIIGGGPAGLNAALVLGRARRNVILFDNDQPRNAVTQESHGFITRDGVSPREFREFAYQDISKYPSVKIKKQKIVEIKEDNSFFRLTTEEGNSHLSKKIIIATGLKETLPNVEGIKDYYGKSLFRCPYCDGWELRDQPLVLISENKRAAHGVMTIYQWSKDIVVCTNGSKIFSDAEEQLFKKKGIRVIVERIAKLKGANGKLEKVIFENGEEIIRTGGFVSTELEQPNHLAKSLGCEMNSNSGIIMDEFGRTNVKGVYAAGDISFGPSQLIIAASQGSRAAIGVNSDLITEEFK